MPPDRGGELCEPTGHMRQCTRGRLLKTPLYAVQRHRNPVATDQQPAWQPTAAWHMTTSVQRESKGRASRARISTLSLLKERNESKNEAFGDLQRLRGVSGWSRIVSQRQPQCTCAANDVGRDGHIWCQLGETFLSCRSRDQTYPPSLIRQVDDGVFRIIFIQIWHRAV